MITSVDYIPFRLSFRSPLSVGGQKWPVREGRLVRIVHDSGYAGYGEWSLWPPVPPAADTFPSTVIANRLSLLDASHGFEALPQWSDPAFTFAIHTAWMDLLARQQGKPLCQLLAPDAEHAIPVNALVGDVAPHEALNAARGHVARGIGCIKLKLGRPDFDDDLAVVESIRREFPAIELRGDVNGRWSPSRAPAYLRALEPFRFAYVEEPVAGLPEMTKLQQHTSIALAADEALHAAHFGQAGEIPIWIVKPCRTGGFAMLHTVIAAAQARGNKVVMTGIFESAVGTAAVAHLAAAWLPEPLPAGIDTQPLFQHDIAKPLPFRHGWLSVTSGSGLGVEPLCAEEIL